MRSIAVVATLLFCLCTAASAATVRVDWAGGGDYLTIQEGVNATGEGDTVLVAPGTYTGFFNRNIDFDGVNRVLISEAGAENTVIDCEQAAQGINFFDGEDTTSVVDGFTIANGISGIGMSYSSAIIKNCIFHGNSGSNGGAILCSYTDPAPVISNCIFYGNEADYRGGAMFCDRSSARIRDCVFYENRVVVGGGSITYGGGAINVHFTTPTAIIKRCTIANNSSVVGGGGINIRSGSGADISESVIAFNGIGPGIQGWEGSVSNCILFGNQGGDEVDGEPDNLYVDPLFCGMDQGNLTLCSNSPCIAGNNTWGLDVGALGQGCGECESAVENSAWGLIKSLLR
jgi:hypothetical protein